MHIVGVDPGLVHTGVVSLNFDVDNKKLTVDAQVIDGPKVPEIKAAVLNGGPPVDETFVEKYKPRSNFGTDPKMTKLEAELRMALPGSKFILNTGVKKVVRQKVMELFGCWTFSLKTHHQDLRSAARIGLYGGLKDDEINRVLYEYVVDHLEGRPWRVLT